MTVELLERQRRFVPTADGCVSLLDVGSGPATLFVHGIGTNALLWRHVIAAVSESRRCIAVDLPLHGQSPLTEGQSLGLTAFADLLEAVCAELKLEDIDVVANDTGGAVAQIFAVRHSERVRSLALTNCETHDNVPPKAVKPSVMLARVGVLAWTGPRLVRNPARARRVVFSTGLATSAGSRGRARGCRARGRGSWSRRSRGARRVAHITARRRAASDRAWATTPRRPGPDRVGNR
jgi:pimeloyl-ACP methyl ester carboxylesterase